MKVGLRPMAAALGAVLVLSACGDGTADSDPEDTVDAAAADDVDDVDESDDVDEEPQEEPAEDEPADDDADEPEVDDEEDSTPGEAGDWSAATIGSCTDLAGFVEQDPDSLTDDLIGTLAEPGGAMRADADLGPLTKAVLLVEANEGVLPRVRYRLRYGTELRDAPPAADPVTVSFVQIDRFNLGPAIHADLGDSLGEDVVGDVAEFGVGPHVSYCLLMQPLTGMTADVFEAARAEIPDSAADGIDCLGAGSCTTLGSIPENATAWEDTGPVGIRIDAVYDALRDGVVSPAGALELALVQAFVAEEDGGIIRWSGFEQREGVDPGQPFVEAVIDFGLGQDVSVDVAMREGHVMDHTMEAAWQRIVAFPGELPEDPSVFGGFAAEGRDAG